MKSCGFTGHRKIKPDKISFVRSELRREIKQAISEGYTRFLCGYAEGADLEFASIIEEIKRSNSTITIEAAIPFCDRLEAIDPMFRSLIEQCDNVHVVCQEYSHVCYRERNRYIAENCERMIAVFNGRSRSGTAQTIRISEKLGRDIRIIYI